MARVLPSTPVVTPGDYERAGGWRGIDAARRLGRDGVIEHLEASGLRGRGGAGFPTARKWSTVCERESSVSPATVVVNAAEGEPGSFKDRAILRANPFAVLEGALVAASTVEADRIVIALKRSFAEEASIMRSAIGELGRAGDHDDISIEVFEGPGEYLYGEETALLEVLDGRYPFPRIAPPYRHGVDEVDPSSADAPPTLVNNVETVANVPGILAHGPSWFRELGTSESPGTIVCTVSGHVAHAGVDEVPMGTPLRQIIRDIGGGPRDGRRIVGAMSGVANPLVLERDLDTPASHEAMEAIGSGLGAAGFIVFDDTTDFAALADGVSRFLAVESCGQCTPCKQDGLALMEIFAQVRGSEAPDLDRLAIDDHLRTITDGARCYLATQHQRVVGSIVQLLGDRTRREATETSPVEPVLIAPIVDLRDGTAVLDERQRAKQPDWSFDTVDSGKSPVERLREAHRQTGRTAPPATEGSEHGDDRDMPAPSRPAPEPLEGAIPAEDVDDDPEAPLYSSVPLETEDGDVVIQQQNVGRGSAGTQR